MFRLRRSYFYSGRGLSQVRTAHSQEGEEVHRILPELQRLDFDVDGDMSQVCD